MLKIGHYFFSTILFWTALSILVEKLIKGNTKIDHYIKNRIVSIVHGLFGFVYPVMYILNPGNDSCSAGNASDKFIITMSISYFIYDFAACLYYELYDISLIIHHVSVIIGYFIAYKSEFGAKVAISGLMIVESSNLVMHLRAILRLKGYNNTQLYNMLDIFYLVQYTLFRGLLCPINLYQAFSCTGVPLVIQLGCLVLCGQSYMFIYIMLKMFDIKITEQRKRSKESVKLFWFTGNPILRPRKYTKYEKETKVF